MVKESRIRSFDFLKGIMAVLIIITHSQYASDHREANMLFPFIIDMAVPIFLIISGYVNCASMDSKSFKACYEKSSLRRKLTRIIIPFLPCAMISMIFWIFIDKVGIKWTIINIIFQRWGQGGYYPIIMVQFVLLFPVILKSTRKLGGYY